MDKRCCECCGRRPVTSSAFFCSQAFYTCEACRLICEAATAKIRGSESGPPEGGNERMSQSEAARDKTRREALDPLKEEVSSWAPLPKGMPAVGQRIKFLFPHPAAGHYGLVTEHKPYPVRQESLPVALLDNGVTAVVRTAREWEAAGPLP